MSCILCPYFGGYGHCAECALPDHLPPHDPRLSAVARARVLQNRLKAKAPAPCAHPAWTLHYPYLICDSCGTYRPAPDIDWNKVIDQSTYEWATSYRKGVLMSATDPVILDVATVNAIIKALDEFIETFKPGSKEAVALWQFKEMLSS